MTYIDRQIAFARIREGERVELFASRILVEGSRAWSKPCEFEPKLFVAEALSDWQLWAAALPACRKRALLTEKGVVLENGIATPFFVTHSAGAVLRLDGSFGAERQLSEPVPWDAVPDSTVVLGPAAVLSLTDFLLNSVLGDDGTEPWPFPDALVVEDTAASPYPPQSRIDGIPICLAPGIAPHVDDTMFMLMQRSERWQRPLNALYNIRRRNLFVRHCNRVDWPESTIVIDSLTPENEPTNQEAAWLATWKLQTPGECQWGAEPIEIHFIGSDLLCLAPGATTAPKSGCISDAIEGDVFGTAPALLLRKSASALHAYAVRP